MIGLTCRFAKRRRHLFGKGFTMGNGANMECMMMTMMMVTDAWECFGVLVHMQVHRARPQGYDI